MNKKLKNVCLAFVTAMAISFSAVFGSADIALASDYDFSYREVLSTEEDYLIADTAIVRVSPSKYADEICTFDAGLYVNGKTVLNNEAHYWLKVEMEDGTDGFIYMEHLCSHTHDYELIGSVHPEDDRSKGADIYVCECGSMTFERYDRNSITVRISTVIRDWASGKETPETVLLDMGVDSSLAAVMELTCNPEALEASGGYSAYPCVGSAFIVMIRMISQIQDDVENEDWLGYGIDVAGVILHVNDILEWTEVNQAIKHYSFYSKTTDTLEVISDAGAADEFIQSVIDYEGELVYEPYEDLCSAEFSGEVYISGPDSQLTVGNTWSLQGFVREGEYDMESVTTEISDLYGTVYYTYTDTVYDSEYYFNSSPCDYALLFNELTAGEYIYKVYVTENQCGYSMKKLVYKRDFSENY